MLTGLQSANAKIKYLQLAFATVLEMQEMLQLLVDNKIDVTKDEMQPEVDEEGDTFKSIYSLLSLIVLRLQSVLHLLIKLCLIKPPHNKDCPKYADLYKNCYKISLQIGKNVEYDQLVQKLNNALKVMKQEVDNFKV